MLAAVGAVIYYNIALLPCTIKQKRGFHHTDTGRYARDEIYQSHATSLSNVTWTSV